MHFEIGEEAGDLNFHLEEEKEKGGIKGGTEMSYTKERPVADVLDLSRRAMGINREKRKQIPGKAPFSGKGASSEKGSKSR